MPPRGTGAAWAVGSMPPPSRDFCMLPRACGPLCAMCVLPHFRLDPALSLRNLLGPSSIPTSGTKIGGSDTQACDLTPPYATGSLSPSPCPVPTRFPVPDYPGGVQVFPSDHVEHVSPFQPKVRCPNPPPCSAGQKQLQGASRIFLQGRLGSVIFLCCVTKCRHFLICLFYLVP